MNTSLTTTDLQVQSTGQITATSLKALFYYATNQSDFSTNRPQKEQTKMSVYPLHCDGVCHALQWSDPAVPIIFHVTVQPCLFFTAPWLGVSLSNNRFPFPFSQDQLVLLN